MTNFILGVYLKTPKVNSSFPYQLFIISAIIHKLHLSLILIFIIPFTMIIVYVPMLLWCVSHWKTGPRAVFGREGP